MKIKNFIYFCLWLFIFPSYANLPDTIANIKSSVVGVGSYNRFSSPTSKILGTGFIVGDGTLVATNAHVIKEPLSKLENFKIVVFVGQGQDVKIRDATLKAIDEKHDLALLDISKPALSPLTLSTKIIREGELFAFTGFPIGGVLGLHPVTHRGIISSITPIATPARTTKFLSIKQLLALKNQYNVYQLDATAYPGNSGSPLYDQKTGEVIAVINKVLVKTTKEAILSDPSAITYAIPVKYLINLLSK